MEYHVEETTIEALTRMLIGTPGPVSYYEGTRPLMERLAKRYEHTLTYDRKHIAYIRAKGEDTTKTVCVSAHLDIIGLMACHINNNGTPALRNPGGINYSNIGGCSVQVHTRDGSAITGLLAYTSHSTHVLDDARSAIREEPNMIVILNELVHSSGEVRALEIKHGNIISIDPDHQFTKSDFIGSRFVDDRAAVAAMFAVLEGLQRTGRKPQYTMLFIFPLYEEIGHGGVYLPQEVNKYVALDISLVGPDYCGSETRMSICAKNNYTPYDKTLTTELIHLAGDQKLGYSVNMFCHRGTDASVTICAGDNVYTIVPGVGRFASHDVERCHIQSVVQTAKLLYVYLLDKQKAKFLSKEKRGCDE